MAAQGNKAIFWDYDVDNMDLSDPEVKKWYYQRKIDFGEFDGISKCDLQKILPKLEIDPSMRELLDNYFCSNA